MKWVEIPLPLSGNMRLFQQAFVYPWSKASPRKPNANCPGCHKPLIASVKKGHTTDYDRWLQQVGIVLKVQLRPIPPAPYRVHLHVWGGKAFPQSRDLDNALKCVGDALTIAKIITDDDVRVVKAWNVEYHTREEHWVKLRNTPPKKSDLAMLIAKCYIALEPITAVGYQEPSLFEEPQEVSPPAASPHRL